MIHFENPDFERKQYQIKALHEAKQYIAKWEELSHKELKGLYQNAKTEGDQQLRDILHPILEATQTNIDIFAELTWNKQDEKR